MKHASLPMGAVEIGTIAEAETDDEEDEEVIEGKIHGPSGWWGAGGGHWGYKWILRGHFKPPPNATI